MVRSCCSTVAAISLAELAILLVVRAIILLMTDAIQRPSAIEAPVEIKLAKITMMLRLSRADCSF